MLGLLVLAGWANGAGQNLPTTNPALERIKLTLVDNQSDFQIDDSQNDYTNMLRINQPEGDNKLTAGMLSQGDNFIVVHRTDDTGATADVARINLNAEITKPNAEPQEITRLEFISDFSGNTITLQAPWASNNVQRDANNGARIRAQRTNAGYIRYTIPQGYDNGVFILNILTSNTGTFRINGTSVSVTTAGWVTQNITGLNSGGQITIQAPNATGNTTQYSPYMIRLYIEWLPLNLMPSIKVTPTLLVGNEQTSLGAATTYGPNDYVSLGDLATVTDAFSAPTGDNQHPDSYSYTASLDANVLLPGGSSATTDFYASVDFTTTEYADPATSAITGDGQWAFPGSYIYSFGSGTTTGCLIEESYGQILFYLPNTFAGHEVNVAVTTCSGTTYGAGDLYVNDVAHTFTAGSTYTWPVTVAANGIIVFKKGTNATYSPALEKIVISSGNASGAPALRRIVATPRNNTSKAQPVKRQLTKTEVSIDKTPKSLNKLVKRND